MKKTNRNNYRAFALGSVGALMLTASVFAIYPEIDNRSFAVTCTNGVTENNAICDTANTEINVNIGEVLSIASVTIDGIVYPNDGTSNPEADYGSVTPGALSSKNILVTADTNVAAGYQMQLQGIKTVEAVDPSDATDPINQAAVNALINTDHPAATIESMTGSDVAAASMVGGTWGYSLNGGTTYSAIPTSATTVQTYTWQEDQSTGEYELNQDTTFTFGVKPADDQTAGTYQGGVRFTVVKN
ncbi:hypothetical protein IKG16_00230 [Candidatus Saccharibacteria bacterium]|nr:hypothetical protein [Candidatus Saccharibacteria bacterium]